MARPPGAGRGGAPAPEPGLCVAVYPPSPGRLGMPASLAVTGSPFERWQAQGLPGGGGAWQVTSPGTSGAGSSRCASSSSPSSATGRGRKQSSSPRGSCHIVMTPKSGRFPLYPLLKDSDDPPAILSLHWDRLGGLPGLAAICGNAPGHALRLRGRGRDSDEHASPPWTRGEARGPC